MNITFTTPPLITYAISIVSYVTYSQCNIYIICVMTYLPSSINIVILGSVTSAP